MQAIGCAGRLTQFSETEDGRYMITLTGVSRRIRGEIGGSPRTGVLISVGMALKQIVPPVRKIRGRPVCVFQNTRAVFHGTWIVHGLGYAQGCR